MLNAKQQLFVKEYLVDLNATQAALRAGYSAKTAYAKGSWLLKQEEIAAQVQEAMNKRAERVGVNADYVLSTIVDTIERCRQAEPVRDKDGNPTGEYQFKENGVLKGCELLGKHLKLFGGPESQVNVNVSFKEFIDRIEAGPLVGG